MRDGDALAVGVDRLDRRRVDQRRARPASAANASASIAGDLAQPGEVARPRIDRRPRLDLAQHRRRRRLLDASLLE